MENLTKQQIVLLTLLVSFVTSIATGIVTVSLLDQASPEVTQTINHVVEKTIEHVVQVPSQAAAIVQKETVVVDANDETVKAIDKNTESLVRIYREGVTESNPEPHPIFQGIGLIVLKDGTIVSDASVVGRESLTAQFEDGTVLPVAVLEAAEGSSTALLKVIVSEKTTKTFVPVTLGNANAVKLGQTIITISGKDKNTVLTGIVSSLKNDAKSSTTGTTTKPTTAVSTVSIETTLVSDTITLGSPLVSLSGDIIGIKTAASDAEQAGTYTPASVILTQINEMKASSRAGNESSD